MSSTRLGIIAGGGDLPRGLAEHARESGRDVFVLGLRHFVDASLAAEFGGTEVALGEIGRAMQVLKDAGCEEIVFAGTVRRPDMTKLQLDAHGFSLLPKLMAVAGKGDDALLRVVLGAFEKAGFRVVGADDILADLLAPAGPLGSHSPSQADWIDIRAAAKAASGVGAADIGQGAVARGGAVISTETEDGTDAMLRRVVGLPGKGGVLVKRPKPQQERRMDLPTIGPATVRNAQAAGLAGVVVAASGALVLNRREVSREADRLGLFVYGFTAVEVP